MTSIHDVPTHTNDSVEGYGVRGHYRRLDHMSLPTFERELEPLYRAEPEGLIAYTAWTGDGSGARVFEVWDSDTARERFDATLDRGLGHGPVAATSDQG